jgi:hypothetical protein
MSEELTQMLLSRNYNKNVVSAAIERVRLLHRYVALENIVLAITYHPKLPSIQQILKKHWRTMTSDQKLLKIFPQLPMVVNKQFPNLKSVLYLAKLPQNTSPKRRLVGMQPCRKP